MSRIRKSDAVEASRCYELIQGFPKLQSSLHSLGTELGRQAPAYGLEWMGNLEYSRSVYFGAVNLGHGFAEYAASNSLEEVVPLFERFLESPLFDGEAYDGKVKGEGSRMRERMTDQVLESLAGSGKLDADLRALLKFKVPARCVPHLESYQVYAWPHEKILREFDGGKFSEECRDSATFIALGRLMEESSLAESLEWINRIKESRTSKLSTSIAFRHYLLEAEHDVFIDILEGIEDPEHFETAIKWAKVKARDTRNEGMKEWVEELEERRR